MLTLLSFFAIINPVLPEIVGGNPQGGEKALSNIIGAVVGLLLIVGAIAALLYLLVGAINWITSAGDKNKLEKAQLYITQAIVGLIILSAVWAIMTLIGTFTGIGFPTFNIPTLENVGTGVPIETQGGGSNSTNQYNAR